MMLKKVSLLFAVMAIMAFTTGATLRSTYVAITPDSSLYIKGTTNVNTFSCLFDVTNIDNPVRVDYHREGDRIRFDETTLVLNVDCFDCGGRGINRDFREILNSEEEPHILLALKEIRPIADKTAYEALLDIEIAGETNVYKVPVKVEKDNSLLIQGDLNVRLPNHNIELPSKMFGLINIHENVEIAFKLGIEEIRN
ncbi:hypothetical protein [Pseudozobellia thermophila]|uniref:YceI-like domain-containing protein n=1 Tax=Pseudozobellia thermophila TaxID=192903 RepID=A0A1M6NSY6_9FLAO|nr:hypothetical protein [Pseudozobellia thermophila]SHJ98770.1 hypothetical protein SAMN04488513_11532 [Pseudozobellia thermophila]